MSRGIWFVAGAGAGVYAMVKVRRTLEAFTPDGLRDRLSALSTGAHLFATEVRTGMTEKETELRERLGLHDDGPPLLAYAGKHAGIPTGQLATEQLLGGATPPSPNPHSMPSPTPGPTPGLPGPAAPPRIEDTD